MHLTQSIWSTIEIGLEVILAVDSNKHMIKVKLSIQLQKLGLVEAYDKKFKKVDIASYFKGIQQIDDICNAHNIMSQLRL